LPDFLHNALILRTKSKQEFYRKKKRPKPLFLLKLIAKYEIFSLTSYAAKPAFANSTNFANAALSNTATSANTLRSTSTDDFFKPFMKRL